MNSNLNAAEGGNIWGNYFMLSKLANFHFKAHMLSQIATFSFLSFSLFFVCMRAYTPYTK